MLVPHRTLFRWGLVLSVDTGCIRLAYDIYCKTHFGRRIAYVSTGKWKQKKASRFRKASYYYFVLVS